MAGVVQNVVVTGRVWWHYLRLDRTDADSATISMEALRDLGNASLPALRHGIRQHDEPRIQLRCGVVLHWLGQREGLAVLVDALRYGSKSRKDPADEVVACFLQIGAPDATQALIELWRQLPTLSDSDPAAVLICGIWRILQDPGMLNVLCMTSTDTPRLFVETVASFGTDAIPELRRMAHDPDSSRRAMCLRALARIPGYSSAQIAVPMLRDSCDEVRELAPQAIEAVSGPVTTLNALVESHRDGYATSASIQMLILYDPPDLFALLAGLLTRYEPNPQVSFEAQPPGKRAGADTIDAVKDAASAFARCPWPHAQVTQILCGVVSRSVHPSIKAAIALTIAERGPAGDDSDIQATRAMWNQLTDINKEARSAAVAALARLGEPFGASFEALLDSCRPQGNLLRKLQTTLFTSQDVGQAMSEAVQHVATWFNRVSRETAERFASPGIARPTEAAVLTDGRSPELLRRILANALHTLETDCPDEEAVEALSIGVSTLRVLSRLDHKAASCADVEIHKAFVTVKTVNIDRHVGTRGAGTEEFAAVLRDAAGQTLIDISGAACYETFMRGLDDEDAHVRISSAGALGRLGDPRATPTLQQIAATGSPALAQTAKDAIAAIRRGNPEMMTLLRSSSSADARQDTLLRPSVGIHDSVSPELLLRPGNPGAPE